MNSVRKINKVLMSKPTIEGAGVHLMSQRHRGAHRQSGHASDDVD
jgi:hypothetical protein